MIKLQLKCIINVPDHNLKHLKFLRKFGEKKSSGRPYKERRYNNYKNYRKQEVNVMVHNTVYQIQQKNLVKILVLKLIKLSWISKTGGLGWYYDRRLYV